MSNLQVIVDNLRGVMIDEREQNLSSDSYFYITYWNVDEARTEHEMYGTTACGNAPGMPSSMVAELRASLLPSVAYAVKQHDSRQRRAAAVRLLDMHLERREVFKGDTVRVARARKVPKGTEGVVMLVTERVTHTSQYGTWETRENFAMIDSPSGMWTTAAKNLDVIKRGPVMQELFDLSC